MGCKIIRKKLVTFGTMSFDGSPMKVNGQEWREEECGTPIFGGGQQEVCSSCLKGWTHENNYMVDSEQNEKLLAKHSGSTCH